MAVAQTLEAKAKDKKSKETLFLPDACCLGFGRKLCGTLCHRRAAASRIRMASPPIVCGWLRNDLRTHDSAVLPLQVSFG